MGQPGPVRMSPGAILFADWRRSCGGFQRREAGAAGLRPWDLVQLVDEPFHVHGGSGSNVLEVSSGEAAIARRRRPKARTPCEIVPSTPARWA